VASLAAIWSLTHALCLTSHMALYVNGRRRLLELHFSPRQFSRHPFSPILFESTWDIGRSDTGVHLSSRRH
jgi:hypothetical protein